MENRGGGAWLLLTRNAKKHFYPERPSGVKDLSSISPNAHSCISAPRMHFPRITGQANFEFQFSNFFVRRVTSVRHRADFFFHFGDIDHDDGIPRAAVQEAAVGAFTEPLLAADALDGGNLDAP